MADFYQHPRISTVHHFGTASEEYLDQALARSASKSGIGLILPVTADDMRADSFGQIVTQLARVGYVSHIVVALGVAPEQRDLDQTLERVAPLGEKARVIWTDGPEIAAVYDRLRNVGIEVGEGGKGRSVWTGIGCLLNDSSTGTIALHDCDIANYERSILARLCLPIASLSLDYDYCKAYYARVTDRMYGRVVRLFVGPLVRALRMMVPENEFLAFLADFRYPLAGEFAMSRNLALTNRMPSDWGLEIGTLAEVFRNTSIKKVCQVDLGVHYEHKHQQLSEHKPDEGLMRMAGDIMASLIATLMSQGVVVGTEFLRTLQSTYVRVSQDAIRQYAADALANDLHFERDREERIITAFAGAVVGVELSRTHRTIPNWSRVLSAVPEIPQLLWDSAHLQ